MAGVVSSQEEGRLSEPEMSSMTDQHLRRSNWPSLQTGEGGVRPASSLGAAEDPLAELARFVGKSDPFAELRTPVAPRPASYPQQGGSGAHQRTEPHFGAPSAADEDDFFGIDADAFEAALQSAPPHRPAVPPHASSAKDPVFDEPALDELERLVRDLDDDVLQAHAQPKRSAYGSEQEAAEHGAAGHYGVAQALAPDAHAYDRDAELYDAHTSYDTDAPYDEAGYAPEPYVAAPQQSRGFFAKSGVITVLSVLGLVVIGAAGAGIYSALSGKRSGAPIVIRADDRPSKVQPDKDANAKEEAHNKLVYDRAGGADANGREKIILRQEQPVDTSQPAGSAAPRVVLPGGPQPLATPPSAEPRRVTTTTIRVRPDGSVEAEPTKPAVVAAVPVAPAPPVAPVVAPVLSEPVAALPVGVPLPKPVTSKPVKEAKVAVVAPVKPVVAPPAQRSPMALMPAAPVAAKPAQVQPAPAAKGSYYVQVSSQKSVELAQNALAEIRRKHAAVLAGQTTSVSGASVTAAGTYYRVRVGPMATRQDALAFCGRMKASGGDCYVP